MSAPTIDPTIRQGELREHAMRIVASYASALIEWHASLGDNGIWTTTLYRDDGGSSKTANGPTMEAAVLAAHQG